MTNYIKIGSKIILLFKSIISILWKFCCRYRFCDVAWANHVCLSCMSKLVNCMVKQAVRIVGFLNLVLLCMI